jgi:hypothetical protein
MPEYHFVCEKCKSYSVEYWYVSEYDDKIKKSKCHQCKSKKIHRAYDLDNVHTTVKEIKTIGQLAEANTKKLGKYGLEEKMLQDKKIVNKEQQEKRDRIRKINKMTPEQKQKWITEGD